MSEKKPPCATCGRPPVDGCARVECASRRPVTAQAWGSPTYTAGSRRDGAGIPGQALRAYTPPEV